MGGSVVGVCKDSGRLQWWQVLGWRQIGECVDGSVGRWAGGQNGGWSGLETDMSGGWVVQCVEEGPVGWWVPGGRWTGGGTYLACVQCDVLLVLLTTLEYSLRALRSPILVVSSLLLGSWYSSCSPGTTKP